MLIARFELLSAFFYINYIFNTKIEYMNYLFNRYIAVNITVKPLPIKFTIK